jgi:HK97 family phage portal protein
VQIYIPFTGKAIRFDNGLSEPPYLVSVPKHKNQDQTSPEFERFKNLLYGISGADMPITAETAIKTAAVIRCVDVVSTDMATMPLDLLRRTAKGSEKAKDHRLYELLHTKPNDETTAFDFRRMFFYNYMLTPAAYAFIERDRNGFITALYNMPSRYCRLKRNEETNERYVEYNNGKIITKIYPENLLYMPGPRLSDSDNPLDPMDLASKVLGLSSSLNDFAANYFKNGANAGAVVSLLDAKSGPLFEQFRDDFNKAYAGIQNSNKALVLAGNVKFEKVNNNPTDAQALESRQYQAIEVCRMMGVSPMKIFEYGRATWGNMEQVNIEYVNSTLNPRAVQFEQVVYRDLLMPFERPSLYAKFNFYSLLKGDTAAQTNHFHLMRNDGVYSANDILELMDRNSLPEEDGGNAHFVNGNLISMKNAMNAQPKQAATGK